MTQPTNGNRPIPVQKTVDFPDRADDEVPWARQVTARQPNTTRNRRVVRDLPGWDPLPPGENLVHRRRRD